MLNNITPIILTFNEEDNLERTLSPLSWANEVLLIDSGSTDRTLEIAESFSNIRVIHNPFESFSQQCNFALQQDIQTDWVLSMDADYVVPQSLIEELQNLKPGDANGYQISFEYLIDGEALRGSLYPPRICLYRHQYARYRQDGHAHKVEVTGRIESLESKIQHDDRKPESRWLASQDKYARQEAQKLKSSRWGQLGFADKLRRLGIGPLLVLPYTLLIKGVILDGRPGWKYAMQRLTAEKKLWLALFRNS